MTSTANLQDRPVPSSIAKDRSLQSTSGKYKRRGNSDTVKVLLHERVRQFPDENFIVREGKLFCNACRQILSTRKSSLKIHVSSKKHQDGKQKMKKSKLREQTIAEAFKKEKKKVLSQKIVCTFFWNKTKHFFGIQVAFFKEIRLYLGIFLAFCERLVALNTSFTSIIEKGLSETWRLVL